MICTHQLILIADLNHIGWDCCVSHIREKRNVYKILMSKS
jgi:hypothetical protein